MEKSHHPAAVFEPDFCWSNTAICMPFLTACNGHFMELHSPNFYFRSPERLPPNDRGKYITKKCLYLSLSIFLGSCSCVQVSSASESEIPVFNELHNCSMMVNQTLLIFTGFWKLTFKWNDVYSYRLKYEDSQLSKFVLILFLDMKPMPTQSFPSRTPLG